MEEGKSAYGARSEKPASRPLSYDMRAYILVDESLSALVAELPERRHVTARECADAVLDAAAARFGVLGDVVLEDWGIHTSADIGRIVFALVEGGRVSAAEDDSVEDFDDLFRVEEVFPARYRIAAGLGDRSAHRGRRSW
ncbi:MAG TPA: Minf_1886 family protein [Gemmatimonadota bacterium]|nr:Minf_1886 family protein [Gemmatimonadota bacterium]